MIEIQPVALDAALAHNNAIQNATHLLSCSDYLIEALPEEVQELSVMADLSVLLAKVGDEISAARVKFQPVEKPAPVAPWRNQQEQEQAEQQAQFDAAHTDIFRVYGFVAHLTDCLSTPRKGGRSDQQVYDIAETIKTALGEMIDKSGIVTSRATFLAATDIADEANREARKRWPEAPAAGRPSAPQPPRPVAPPQVAPIATGMIDQVDKIRAIADGMDENCETAIALNQIAAQLEIESVVLSRLAA